jgi:hypothetical protein
MNVWTVIQRNDQNYKHFWKTKFSGTFLLTWSNYMWVSEWLLFNTNSAIFQLYDGENKYLNTYQRKTTLTKMRKGRYFDIVQTEDRPSRGDDQNIKC